MIILDYKDTRPVYEQIVEKMQNLILQGVLEPDTQLPSVRALAVEISTNPNTVQKAYSELERRGFMYTVKGKGAFVSYNEELLDWKKQDLRQRIQAVLKEADELHINRSELLQGLENKEE